MMRWVAVFTLLCSASLTAQDANVGCAASRERPIAEELWTKVLSSKCLVCHRTGGDAEASRFLLTDLKKVDANQQPATLQKNWQAFRTIAATKEKDRSRVLQKVVGELNHGGGEVLAASSVEYRLLADVVRGLADPGKMLTSTPDKDAKPFFDGVTMLDDRRLLRRVTLSLAGRLPNDAELAAITKPGALPGIVDAIMKEDAFYDRLREGFNDIFLLQGVDGNPDQNVLSYEHFEKTRLWYQKFDLSHIADEKERRQAGYKLAGDYRKALLAEPMKLVEHIVRHDRPFTEIVTADYIIVSPYSARGYGVFDQLQPQFKNTNDPFEFLPVKLKALKGRSPAQNQDSATGDYPHAGLLSTFQYLARYPTTETNRNRLRARMYYQHFLGVDVLELAARVSDAATATAKYKIPTMQAPECVVCHRTLDPVAGIFQDYWRFAEMGIYGKRKGGWFDDMFSAGFEEESLPNGERWRAIPWLGERTAKDPRFAVAMVEHVYFILTGRKVLLPPKDLEDPLYPARQRAYQEQRQTTERLAAQSRQSQFSLKAVFQGWIASEFYRAEGLANPTKDACRKAELDDAGIVRLVSPEQLERKIAAIFGERWGKLTEQMATLYGGIDSKEVTDRATDPSGAMGAIQRTMSNDVACKQVAKDFARPAHERRLFPTIEKGTLPGNAEADQQIRLAIVKLHERILGRYDATNSEEVSRTFKLFTSILADAKAQKTLDKRESYYCRPANRDDPTTTSDDPDYTLRAWRAVVTYLLRRPEFLYE
ncbi:MAG: hypothetical protein ACRC8S_03940 [Fimbriiglobus sp.]